jgi:hypothetical protein
MRGGGGVGGEVQAEAAHMECTTGAAIRRRCAKVETVRKLKPKVETVRVV